MTVYGFDSDKRKGFIVAFFCIIAAIYIGRLFYIQVVENKYKDEADSNAFYNKKLYPPRGVMYDRNGELLVFNQPSYDLMVTMRETSAFDTLALCEAIGVDIEYFRKKLTDIKSLKGYSRYTPQPLITQIGGRENGLFQEKKYLFPGFEISSKTIREYNCRSAAHLLGYIAEVDKRDMSEDEDQYYDRGDMAGKTGIEKQYEKELRGVKGVEKLLRDARGRIIGSYENGEHDREPVPGKDLTLSIDICLQAYGEELMQNKLGSIIMIEPQTGEILCMVSSPSYDPSALVGRQFGETYRSLSRDVHKPLINRAINGTFPPGSTFKPAQALVLLEENIIQPSTAYSCFGGWPLGNGHPACHSHGSPLALAPAIGTSCNAYFCWGLKAMLENKKYPSIQNAIDIWKDRMKNLGFGRRLGIDLPSEKKGHIPGSEFYDRYYPRGWTPFTVISIAIGQGEVEVTPLQICNLAVQIANRGFFYAPHAVKKIKDQPLESIYTERQYSGIAADKCETVVEGMRTAVTGGTCRIANLPEIEVCGKTGTAQNRGRDHSLFMGFAPKDNPKVAIAVLVENGGFGASAAVPVGRLMIEKYLNGSISAASLPYENMIKNMTIIKNALPQK
jgi:penicillin-binding protein 2